VAHLSRMRSTSWRKSSQVLYSSGRSFRRDQHLEWVVVPRTYVKLVVLAHLPRELAADPRARLRAALCVEPPAALHRAHDPAARALLREDPAEPGVVRRAPERKVREEEDARVCAREEEEEEQLRAEEAERRRVDVRFRVRRVEERGEDVVRRRHPEHCAWCGQAR
jgi:hypothetical protein